MFSVESLDLSLTQLLSPAQVSDGAAAVLLTRRSKAQELGLPILAKVCHTAVAGVEPKLMGIGPAFAIPKVLEKTGLSKDDVDLYEINEGEFLRGALPLSLQSDADPRAPFHSLCVAGCHVDRAPRPRLRQGQPERRCHRSWPPARLHRALLSPSLPLERFN